MCGLSGLTSLAYEVLWTRYFVNSFMSTVTAFSTILIAYLGGLAIGAYVASVLSRRARITLLHLGLVQGVVALLGLGLLRLFESLPEWFLLLAVKAGSVDTARVLVVVSTMLLPVCLMGMVLPLGMHLLRRGRAKVSSTVGLLAAASSAGSTAGPLLAAFVALPLLGLARSIVAVAALQAVACLGLALRRGPGSSAITSRWGAAALVLGVSALAMGATQAARYGAGVGGAGVGGRGVLPPQLVIGQSERVLHYRETSHGTVVVSANETTGARTLFIDGFAATSNSGTTAYMRMMSHLPALALSHTPESVLVICLGTGITLGAASLYRPSTLDCVELNPEVVPCTGFFREENHDVLSNPSVRLVIDDGRNWLRMSGRRYDVITLEPLAPFFAGTVSLYTREFNALARAHLTPGGIFTQWLPLHLVSDRDARSIVRAVTAEFPHVIVWKLVGDVSAIILASERPIDLGAGGARPDAAREDVVRYLPAGTNVADHVVLDEAGVAAYVAGVSPLSDDRPTVEYRALGHERLRLGSKELSDANTTRLREAAGLPPEK
jgi:spermidine synthase